MTKPGSPATLTAPSTSTPRQAQSLLQHYTGRRSRTTFRHIWDTILTTAQNAVEASLNESLGKRRSVYADQHRDVPQEDPNQGSPISINDLFKLYTNAAMGARSTLKYGYMSDPTGPAYTALYDFIGREAVKTVLAIAGPKATLNNFNIVIKNLNTFEEAKRENPNAVLLWFRGSSNHPGSYPTFNSPQDIISQARSHLLNTISALDPSADHTGIWESFSLLNHAAVARYLEAPSDLAETALQARDAGTSPSFTAIRTLISQLHTEDQSPKQVTSAFIVESARRAAKKGKSQSQLANQFSAVNNPWYMDTDTGTLKVSINTRDALRDLIQSRDHTTPLSWQEIEAALPHLVSISAKSPNSPKPKKARRNPANPRPTYTNAELREILEGPAKPAVLEALSQTVKVTVDPGNSVRITVPSTIPGDPEPTLTVWKDPAGAIRHQASNYHVHGPLPDPTAREHNSPNWTTRGLQAETSSRILANHLETNWQALTPTAGAKPPSPERLNSYLHRITHPDNPASVRVTAHVTDRHLSEQLSAGIASLVDPKVHRLASAVSFDVDIPTYNTVARAYSTIQHLAATNPGALTWAMTSDTRLDTQSDTPLEMLEHPGQLIAQAKRELINAGLDPRNWRRTTTLPPDVIKEVNRPIAESDQPFDKTLTTLAKAFVLNAIADSHIVPNPATVRIALRPAALLIGFQNQRSIHPSTARNMTTMLTLIIKSGVTEPDPDMQDCTDYVHNLNFNKETLTATTLNGLRKAAARWHRQLRREPIIHTWNTIIRNQNGFYRAWNPGLKQHTDGQYTITPLSTEYDLYEDSLEMEHCVVGYGDYCVDGHSRIFSISDSRGRRLATTELTFQPQGWTPTQTRARHNHQVSTELHQAAQRIADRYQRTAHQDNAFQWVDPETGKTYDQHPSPLQQELAYA